MSRISRYIFKTIVSSSLVALLVLVMLDFFISLLSELQSLGEGNYGLAEIFQYLALTLPSRLYQAFPMALLLGGLLGMGALASGSELVVMRASGCSVLRLVRAAMQAGLVLGLLALGLGEYVAPKAEQLAQELKTTAQLKSLDINDGKGFWARDGDRVINVRSVLPGPVLSEIYIFEIGDEANLEAMGRAQAGRFAENQWIIEGMSRSVIGHDQVTVEHTARTGGVGSVINPDMLQVLSADPNSLAIRDLAHYVDYLSANGLDTRSYELAFWLKVLSPFTNMALLFVAMPFVFGTHRSASAGQRIVIGIFLGLLFFLMNRMLGNLVLLYGYHPIIGASLPTVAFFLGGALALSRAR